MDSKDVSRFPDSSPARMVSINVGGSLFSPRSVKLPESERPASTSRATPRRIFFSCRSAVFSPISCTALPIGTPARRMMANWLHISVSALASGRPVPISLLRSPPSSSRSTTGVSFKTISQVLRTRSAASNSLKPSTTPVTRCPSREIAEYLYADIPDHTSMSEFCLTFNSREFLYLLRILRKAESRDAADVPEL